MKRLLAALLSLTMGAALLAACYAPMGEAFRAFSVADYAANHPDSLLLEEVERLGAGAVVYAQTVYTWQWSTLLGGQQEIVALPYCIPRLTPVGTAGTSHWQIDMGVLAAEGAQNGRLTLGRTSIRRSDLFMEAYSNTRLSYNGMRETPTNVVHWEDREGKASIGTASLTVSAATWDSSVFPNRISPVSLSWSGVFSVNSGLFSRQWTEFSIPIKTVYRSNVK